MKYQILFSGKNKKNSFVSSASMVKSKGKLMSQKICNVYVSNLFSGAKNVCWRDEYSLLIIQWF